MKKTFVLLVLAVLGISYAQTCDAGFRLFDHPALVNTPVCIPENPQRIVTLQDQNALLPLYELGFRGVVGSVGAETPDGVSFFRRMDDYDTSSITYVGRYGTPNLEAILALSPDLIIGPNRHEDIAEQLSEIAPTLLLDVFAQPLPETMAIFADIVGTEARLADLQQQYNTRVAEVSAARDANGFDTVSMVIFLDDATFLIEPSGSVTEMLQAVGFSFPPPVQEVVASGERGNFSVEVLNDFDTDLFLWPYFGMDASADRAPALRQSPLWITLNVVKSGNAHAINGERWYGLSFGNLLKALEDIETFVTTSSPAESSQ
ncbi:MAG: ABC transporter substrate-binding protein [Deinococcota bacterium]